MKTVRAKFKVVGKSEHEIILRPVYDPDPNSENGQFYKYTPAGHITLTTVNQDAADAFFLDKEYYVDFIPAFEAEAAQSAPAPEPEQPSLPESEPVPATDETAAPVEGVVDTAQPEGGDVAPVVETVEGGEEQPAEEVNSETEGAAV